MKNRESYDKRYNQLSKFNVLWTTMRYVTPDKGMRRKVNTELKKSCWKYSHSRRCWIKWDLRKNNPMRKIKNLEKMFPQAVFFPITRPEALFFKGVK